MSLVKKTNVNSNNKQDPNPSIYILYIKIRSLSLGFSHVNTNIFVIFLEKTEIFDLHAVSIFATGTCESDTTTSLFVSCGTQFIAK
jgi:hypothetical protein